MSILCVNIEGLNGPSSRTVPIINGTDPPVPCDSRFAEESLRMPPGPSRTETREYNPPAKVAFMPVTRSDLQADMRQANVSFGGAAVAHEDTFFAKSVHERVER